MKPLPKVLVDAEQKIMSCMCIDIDVLVDELIRQVRGEPRKPPVDLSPEEYREEVITMSYKCEACKQPTKAGQKMLKAIVKKPDGQIAREIKLCPSCKDLADKAVEAAKAKAEKERLLGK